MLPDIAPVSAHDLTAMLRRHYLPDGRPPGGIFAGEIESPDGRRRADALWAPWSVVGGAGIVGHEIKVSRSDVLVELTDPMKSEPWIRYCSRWWLVVAHPSLVSGLAVPESWGIMSPPSGRRTRTMTVVREAPALKPADTGPAWRRIASWEHYRLTDRMRDLEYKASRAQSDAEYARRELAQRELAGEGRASPHAVKIGEVLTQLDRAGWRARPFEADEIAGAILDVDAYRALQQRADMELRSLVDDARRLTSPLTDIARKLDELRRRNENVA